MDTIKTRNINAIPFIILTITFFLTYYSVFFKLINAWNSSEEYSHGFLIIPISLYIIWTKKDILSKIAIEPSWSGLIIIILSLLLYIISNFADILTLAPISMIIFLFGVVIYLYGFQMMKELTFPLFFLFFMIPVPAQIYSSLTIPLQLFVSKVSVDLAGLLNITIYREGNVIHLPERTLQVVQACSGLRSMISLLTLSAVFGYLTLYSNVLRTFLFITGVPVAVLVNIIRVLLMIVAFHYFNYDLTEGSIHTIFGVVIFGLALISIALIKRILSLWDKSTTKE